MEVGRTTEQAVIGTGPVRQLDVVGTLLLPMKMTTTAAALRADTVLAGMTIAAGLRRATTMRAVRGMDAPLPVRIHTGRRERVIQTNPTILVRLHLAAAMRTRT
jgi:hypothetical protein